MAKLHELLAVESTLRTQVEKARTDLANTFEKKRHHFGRKLVTFRPADEAAQPVTEEQLDLQTTVPRELEWLRGIWTPAIDVAASIATTNQAARADVILDDGRTLLKDIPATALLDLEKRLNELQTLVAQVPTLDPAKGFVLDPAEGPDVYRAREDVKTRTRKEARAIVLYDATKEHPAQTQLIQQDVPVGTIHQQEWSGLISTADKATMLSRVEELRRAVKAARSRANETPAATVTIGAALFGYVIAGR